MVLWLAKGSVFWWERMGAMLSKYVVVPIQFHKTKGSKYLLLEAEETLMSRLPIRPGSHIFT